MKKVIFTQSNGIIAVMTPVLTEINPATGVEFTLQEIIDKDLIPTGITTFSIVEDSVIPADRTFRSAWVGNGVGVSTATIVEDITKAREIHKDNIRRKREPKFKELDIEFQKAQETGADTSDIVAKKNALRDAPAASGIATATNTTELRAQWDTSILGTSPYQ